MTVEKQLIFIDDSGDPGFKRDSSGNFIMAAAVFVNQTAAEKVNKIMANYRASIGWQERHEFKFAKNPKNIVSECLKKVTKCDFDIYAVYINKSDFKNTSPKTSQDRLYNWLSSPALSIARFTQRRLMLKHIIKSSASTSCN